MDNLVSCISQSLFLLALGTALGSLILAGFVKSCSHFGLLPASEEDGEWRRYLTDFD
jgi:hypothetical protein